MLIKFVKKNNLFKYHYKNKALVLVLKIFLSLTNLNILKL